MSRRVLPLAIALGLTGCASLSSVQSADTLGAGRVQVALEPKVQAAGRLRPARGAAYPHLDVAVRWGVTERVDVGFRVGQSLLELQAKLLLTTPGAPGPLVSVAPSVGGFLLVGDGWAGPALTLAVPLLVGLPVGGGELVLGPRLQQWLAVGPQGPAWLAGPGLSLGYLARLTPELALLPEVAVVAPLVLFGPLPVGFEGGLTGPGGLLLQGTVGVLLGQQRRSAAAP